jgi:ABC-type polysaccharide/polyol phosphate export permease
VIAKKVAPSGLPDPLRHPIKGDQKMTLDIWIRQIHRWLSIIFATVVIAIFITLGVGKEPAYWVYLSPLFPLALLMLTGLYMFVLPYAARWRSARRIDGQD